MAVPEPTLTIEKLLQLLSEGHESATLDYKRTIEFDEKDSLPKRSQVELAKDIAAMQVLGGYIVIGADQTGNPTGDISLPLDKVQRAFDESRIRNQVKKWIPEPFDLRTAVHEIDDKLTILIYVGPRQDGFCVFAADGDIGQERVFHRGDVYIRHGSASERWQPEDVPAIIRTIMQREKEVWRSELSRDLAQLGIAASAQHIAHGPATALTWQLDSETFSDIVLELFRANDDIPVRMFLNGAATRIRELAEQPEGENDIITILDRLTCVTAIAATHNRDNWLRESIQGLVRVYNIGFDQHGSSRTLAGIQTAQLWLAVLVRLMATGALLVRLENWDGVRLLVRRPRQDGDFRYDVSWIRHGLTMAARARLLDRVENGRTISLSILQLARNLTAENTYLRPELMPDDEETLNSLCQFDFLAGIVAIGDSQDRLAPVFYPSFAQFYSFRTEPVILRLIQDSVMRAKLFPYTDLQLADAMRLISQAARREPMKFAVWDGFENRRVLDFLRKNPATD